MFGIAAILLYFVLRSILRPLRLLTEGAERIKSGDLTEPITVLSNDEIGRVSESFNEMSDSLRLVLLRLDDSISQVAASSQELLANSAHNTASSEQIARAVDQMAVSADGSKRQPDNNATSLQAAITSGIMRISESSMDVSELSRETSNEAEDGSTTVKENVKQMQAIDASVVTFEGVIHSLAHRSNEIGEIPAGWKPPDELGP